MLYNVHHFGTSQVLPGYKVKSKEQIESQGERWCEGGGWLGSTVVWGSYLVLKYALMVAGDPFITRRKQKGVSLLI